MTLPSLNPRHWPLTLKVPMLVATLTIAVALVVSNLLLGRLADDQEQNLRQLTGAYLDGLSTALLPNVPRHDIWETFDVLDRARQRYAGINARYVIVTLPDGSVLASSTPRQFPVGQPLPPEITARLDLDENLAIDYGAGLAWIGRRLRQENIELGGILAEIDISDLLRVRREVLLTLIVANAGFTLLFALGGYVAARHMVGPIAFLTAHVERMRHGDLAPIAPASRLRPDSELGQLFSSFNAMAHSLREREALATRLAEEEKIALLGKLASGMAHEVNNPLGGMLTLVDTLRKHGGEDSVRRRALDLLERGLTGIGDVVRAMLATYKGTTGVLSLSKGALDDLRFLIQHEVRQRRLRLHWDNQLSEPVAVDGGALRQIALNLLLNACAATPPGGEVSLQAGVENGMLRLLVADGGPGLPAEVAAVYGDPTSADHPPRDSVGLGVWTVRHLVNRLGGRIETRAGSAQGAAIVVSVPVKC